MLLHQRGCKKHESALCDLCPGVTVPTYTWWHWGVGGLSIVMVGSVVICSLLVFSAFWSHSHLVLLVGEFQHEWLNISPLLCNKG